MPRRKIVGKREILQDPLFGDIMVARFIHNLMRTGKKSVAERILYKAFDIIQRKTKEEPLKIFKRALDNVKPTVEVKSRRVGGSTYQVPTDIRPERRTALSVRWLILAARGRREYSMEERLAAEILDASNNTGTAVKKREDTHRMAEANRAFSHYRW